MVAPLFKIFFNTIPFLSAFTEVWFTEYDVLTVKRTRMMQVFFEIHLPAIAALMFRLSWLYFARKIIAFWSTLLSLKKTVPIELLYLTWFQMTGYPWCKLDWTLLHRFFVCLQIFSGCSTELTLRLSITPLYRKRRNYQKLKMHFFRKPTKIIFVKFKKCKKSLGGVEILAIVLSADLFQLFLHISMLQHKWK